MDATPVTNRAFAKFVEATDYVTECELAPDPHIYPDMDAALALPASAVFWPTEHPIEPIRVTDWWRLEPGACWRKPLGGGSSIAGLEDHPVGHVTFSDAQAYAGNVWEWTSDWFEAPSPASACCAASTPALGCKVLKGGSHLCSSNYCRRYRPAARYSQPMDTSTSQVASDASHRLWACRDVRRKCSQLCVGPRPDRSNAIGSDRAEQHLRRGAVVFIQLLKDWRA